MDLPSPGLNKWNFYWTEGRAIRPNTQTPESKTWSSGRVSCIQLPPPMLGWFIMLYKLSPTQGIAVWRFLGKSQIQQLCAFPYWGWIHTQLITFKSHLMRREWRKWITVALSRTLFHLGNANLLVLWCSSRFCLL